MKWLVGLLIVAVIGVAAWRLAPTLRSVNTIVRITEQLLDNHKELVNQLQAERSELVLQSKELQGVVLGLTEENKTLQIQVGQMQAQTAKLIESIPPVSDVVPTDLETCLAELTTARRTAESWKMVSEHQQKEISYLNGIIRNQETIIQTQATQIEIQYKHITNLHDAHDSIISQGKRSGYIGAGIGVVIGIIAIIL